MKLESFDSKSDTPEIFLVTLQNMAVRPHPDPIPNVVPPVAPRLDTAARVAD